MKYKRLTATLLCLLLILSGCAGKRSDKNTQALLESYGQAQEAFRQATDFTVNATYALTRTVNGHSYTQSYSSAGVYSGYGTEDFSVSTAQVLKYGSFEKEYAEIFLDNTAYCTTDGYTFCAEMTTEEFNRRLLPLTLVDPALYQQVKAHSVGANNVLVFSGATVMESWTAFDGAQLISASATATLDHNGTLKESTYMADFLWNGLPCRVEATVSAVAAPLSEPIIPPESSTPIAFFDAPKLILQTVGGIYSADSVSAVSNETLLCNAASLVQTSQRTVNFLGKGTDFTAKTEYTATITNYTGIPSSSTLTETFLDGTYRYALNGGTQVTQPNTTAETMRTDCEDLLLSGLFTPAHMQNAELTDTGDFYLISFTGNAEYIDTLCTWIYSGIGADLDSYASSTTTNEATGWLSVDKRTGLPTAIGQTLKLTHVIEHVSYPLIYEYSQSLLLSGNDTALNITGTQSQEAAPDTMPTPLLYKVTDANGNQMWLFGTIHVGDNATAYLPAAITEALRSSDALAVEMNQSAFEEQLKTDSALQQQLASGYYYTDGSSVPDYLTPELYAKVRPLLLASGQYNISADRMKVALWENAIGNFLLQQSYDLTASRGVDLRLIGMAEQYDLPILDIEDPLQHALLTTTYSPALQAYLLEDTAQLTVAEYAKSVRELYDLWCQGDEAALTEALKEDISEFTEEELLLHDEYHKALLTDRNAVMLAKAQTYLDSGDTVFFAVGLAHVLGDEGLVTALRNAGYTVEIVSYT